jgi:lysophospholipase L1-like esterase
MSAFLRGAAWPAAGEAAYPRADPADAGRLPADTWATARLPVGVRLELVGDAPSVRITYTTATDELGYRGPGAGTSFVAYRGEELVDEQPAALGDGTVVLGIVTGDAVVTVHLPEGMRPLVTGVEPDGGGAIAPAPTRPRWLCYGDSIAEGWIASGPAGAWPAVAARRFGLDVVNLGYAGAARGEIVSAEHIAAQPADVISISHGTNCWTRIPHSRAQMVANTEAFLDVVRQGHPDVPIVLASPVVRPDAETTPNRLGATLADLREAMEEVGRARVAAGDARLTVVPGAELLDPDHLADGVHPGDEGHRLLADAIGGAVAEWV